MKFYVYILALVCGLYLGCTAVDLEGAFEPCFEIKKDMILPADLNWMFTAPNLYYNVMSRTDLYLLAMDLSGKKAEELREDEVYYDSCITYEMTPELYVAKGFNNGKRIGYKMNATKGFEIYDYTSTDGEMGGRCYTTLTDNKTYINGACCLHGNRMSWGIASSVRVLPQKVIKELYENVLALGFKKEHFTQFRYDSCPYVK